jgi:hypothetical protein
MAAVRDVRQKQRAVVEFLECENEMVENIRKRFQKVYGKSIFDCSTISHWAQRTSGKGGHANICDFLCICWPQLVQKDANVESMKDMVMANRHITVKQLSL